MNVLLTLRDADFSVHLPEPTAWRVRHAARAVVTDSEGNVALLHARKYNYHKLPGGGVEDGEDMHRALERECLEEIGCHISNVQPLGEIVEYRNRCSTPDTGLHQISHCFTAEVVGEKGVPSFTESEVAEGFEVVWMPMTDAIRTLTAEKENTHYEAQFMTTRELHFLESAFSHMHS